MVYPGAAADSLVMGSLSFAAKMAIIGAVFVLPIALLIVVLYFQINGDATFYKLERVGVTYTKALRPLFTDLEAYRVAGRSDERAAIASRVDADFRAAFAVDAEAGKPLHLTGDSDRARNQMAGSRGDRHAAQRFHHLARLGVR